MGLVDRFKIIVDAPIRSLSLFAGAIVFNADGPLKETDLKSDKFYCEGHGAIWKSFFRNLKSGSYEGYLTIARKYGFFPTG